MSYLHMPSKKILSPRHENVLGIFAKLTYNKRNKFIPPSDKSNNDEGDGEDGGCNENRSGRRRTVDRNLTLSIAYLFDTMSE